jgi:TRAP-type mannitol/chloroaromatic compound transport system permease small subunit
LIANVFLGVALAGLLLALNARRPMRNALLLIPSFFAAWLVAELATQILLLHLVGVVVLLLPFCWLLWDVALPYVEAAWRIREGSRETAGLPFVYLLKTAMLAFVVLLALQGLSLALRAITVLTGHAPAHLAAPEP